MTKEMIVNFSNTQKQLADAVTTTIQGEPVDIVQNLVTIFDNLLRFCSKTLEILRICQQRQYLLRNLRSFDVCMNILITFYYSFTESLMTSFTC